MSDFELGVEILMPLVEDRPMLWDKTTIFIKKETKQERLGGKYVVVLKKALQHQEMFMTTVRKQHGNNRITVRCRSLRVHGYLVSVFWSFDRPVRIGDVIKVASRSVIRPVSCRPFDKDVWKNPKTSFTRSGFRSAGRFRLSPDRTVEHSKA